MASLAIVPVEILVLIFTYLRCFAELTSIAGVCKDWHNAVHVPTSWRTMLVIPELEQEVKLLSESKSTRKELRHLRMERDSIEDRIHHLEWSLKLDDVTENQKEKLFSEHDNLLEQREHVRLLHQEAQRQHHQKFHKVWGQLMKTGYQNSRFAHQVAERSTTLDS
ncbi:unnamed protein product [Miscanthus lutarioriparius]|uniref:F-box domain-containing protein n=1 Tax=Miscanthus lutarioriparius TaxID=422564 RepID=A0A811MQP0_9POAL|nr:unnamed protein product [Miscanthus lutarioriparius]